MRETDDTPRRTDPRKRLVAIVLVLCLVLTMAPFLASLIF
jgi:hypothetical protein